MRVLEKWHTASTGRGTLASISGWRLRKLLNQPFPRVYLGNSDASHVRDYKSLEPVDHQWFELREEGQNVVKIGTADLGNDLLEEGSIRVLPLAYQLYGFYLFFV